jgi:hypothetical protein
MTMWSLADAEGNEACITTWQAGTAEPIYDRTGGGQPPGPDFLSQTRRPTPRRLRPACG